MKRSYLSLPAKIKSEVILSAVLLTAIATVLLWPVNTATALASSRKPVVFQLMESDYLQPKLGSARHVQALNGSSGSFLGFAGYDEFQSSVRLPRGKAIANMTRFAGDIFKMLEIQFLLRDRSGTPGRRVFLSEKFWAAEFARDAAVIGREFQINGTAFRIAGVVRSTDGFLSKTDVWIPVCSRSMAAESASLKLIGAAKFGMDCARASRALIRNTQEHWRELVLEVFRKPTILPLDRGMTFGGPEMDREMIATSATERTDAS